MTHDTDQLLQQLTQNGHVKFQLLSPEETAHLKELLQGLEVELCTGSQSKIQHRIAELIPKGGAAIAQLVCHPDLMSLLRQYLGHNFRCATFSSNTLLPQDGSHGSGLGWHADYPYHDIAPPWPPPDYPLGCQVMICLDDFREDNGGTMFMPNSHKDKPDGLEDDAHGSFPGSVILTAPAGTVLVAHSAWMHRQTMNTSTSVRRALLGNYTPGHIVPKDNMEKQWHMLRESPEFDLLSTQQREMLERLLLGSFKRGLYVGSPRP